MCTNLISLVQCFDDCTTLVSNSPFRGVRRCKIFVGNVHQDTELDELRNLFTPHGTVVEADIISHYAFVVRPRADITGALSV